ncbi:OsmC family protein [Streptomyces sp. NPDC006477]|uniref:OsmC family protein n=1 Tax=Streptomyces sp. NPDC006477 TaxID=3364747 RepID=UPI003688F33D
MRNGLNISGVSELIHEIREKPEEALIDFRVTGHPARDGVATHVRTARHGSVRMARGFRVDQLSHRTRPQDAVTAAGRVDPLTSPYESALTALGACALITHVNGFTGRGVALDEIELTARAELPLDASGHATGGAGLLGLAWRCTVTCGASDDVVQGVNRLVTAFSPNHRVFLDEADLTLRALVTRGDGRRETLTLPYAPAAAPDAGAPAADPALLEVHLRWEYGTEVHARTSLEHGGTRREGASVLVVDQSKQMLGIGKGPNPQELLLSAVCGELVGLVREETDRTGTPVDELHVAGGGRLDIRGMQNVLREVPSRFHNLGFDLEVTSDADLDALAAVLTTALGRSVLLATLVRPNTIAIELGRPGAPDTEYLSSSAAAEAFRDELSRQQQEAARAAEAAASEAE